MAESVHEARVTPSWDLFRQARHDERPTTCASRGRHQARLPRADREWLVAITFHDPQLAVSMSLRLQTPDTFEAFPFLPYEIQLQLMQHLYGAIEDRKVTIVESPTGTVSRVQRVW